MHFIGIFPDLLLCDNLLFTCIYGISRSAFFRAKQDCMKGLTKVKNLFLYNRRPREKLCQCAGWLKQRASNYGDRRKRNHIWGLTGCCERHSTVTIYYYYCLLHFASCVCCMLQYSKCNLLTSAAELEWLLVLWTLNWNVYDRLELWSFINWKFHLQYSHKSEELF